MTWLAKFKFKKPRSLSGILSRKNRSLPHSPVQHELEHEAATMPLPNMTDYHKEDGDVVKPTTEKVGVVSQVMEATKTKLSSDVPGDVHAPVETAVASKAAQETTKPDDEDYTLKEKAAVPTDGGADDAAEAEALEDVPAGVTMALNEDLLEEEAGVTAALDASDAVSKPLDSMVPLEKVEEAPAAAEDAVAAKGAVETTLLAETDVELDKGDKALIESEEVSLEVDGPGEPMEDAVKAAATKEVKLEADTDTAALVQVPDDDANTLDAPAVEAVASPPPPPKTPYEEFLDDYDLATEQVAAKQNKAKEIEKQIADLEAKGSVALPSLAAAKRELRHATVEQSIAEKRLLALKEEGERIAKLRDEATERDASLDKNTNNIKDLLVQLEKTQAATVDSAAAARKAQMEAQKKAEEEEAFLAELAEDKELVHVHEGATQSLKTAIEQLKAKDAELSKMKLQDLANYNAVVDAEEHVALYQELLKEARADREKMTEDVSDEESIQTLGRVHTYEEKLELTQNRLKAAKEAAAKFKPDFEKTQAEFSELQALLLQELQKCHTDASSRESIKDKVTPKPPPPPPVVEEVPPPPPPMQPEAPAKPVVTTKAKVPKGDKKKETPVVIPVVHSTAPLDGPSKETASGLFRSKSGEFIRTKSKSSFNMAHIKKLLFGKKSDPRA